MSTSKYPAPYTIWSSLEHEARKKDTPVGLHRILIGQSCPGTLAASFVPACNFFRVAGTKQGVNCSRNDFALCEMKIVHIMTSLISFFFTFVNNTLKLVTGVLISIHFISNLRVNSFIVSRPNRYST